MGLACRTFAPLTAAGSLLPLLLPSHTRTRSLVFARRSHGKKIFSSAGGKGRKRPSPLLLLLGEREEEEETAVVKRKEGGRREGWRQQKPPHSPLRPLASAPFLGWQAADKVAAAEEGGSARKKELSLSFSADNKRRRSPFPSVPFGRLRNAENK